MFCNGKLNLAHERDKVFSKSNIVQLGSISSLAYILAFYKSTNAKRSFHAFCQNMKTSLANPVNYDTGDDAPSKI